MLSQGFRSANMALTVPLNSTVVENTSSSYHKDLLLPPLFKADPPPFFSVLMYLCNTTGWHHGDKKTCNLRFEPVCYGEHMDRPRRRINYHLSIKSRSGQSTCASRPGRSSFLAAESSWSRFQTSVCPSAAVRALMNQQPLHRSAHEDKKSRSRPVFCFW